MALVFSGSTKPSNKVRVIKKEPVRKADPNLEDKKKKFSHFIDSKKYLKQYILYQDILDVLRVNGYLKASMTKITDSAVGTWWTLAKADGHQTDASEENEKILKDFYNYSSPEWDNIKDFSGMSQKIAYSIFSLKFFGQAGFHVLRDKDTDEPIGLDVITGFIMPNIDERGYFKSPAFYQISENGETAEYDKDEVVFITRPAIDGNPAGDILVEALAKFSLPLDIYLQSAAVRYIENGRLPPSIWELPENITDDGFNELADYIEQEYTGQENIGKSPIVVSGEINVKRVASFPEDIPYLEARDSAKTEAFTLLGTPGAKFGISDELQADILGEIRKEFHESTMEPLFRYMEEGLFMQIHKRLFDIKDWEFQFNAPDFLDKVERATVHMRYIQNGVYNANEVRADLGKGERPGGDRYVEPDDYNRSEEPGSPPEGREDEPDDPSETGEPTIDDQDPPRGDRRSIKDVLDEIDTFNRFIHNRWQNETRREFEFEVLASDLRGLVLEIEDSSETLEDFANEIYNLKEDIRRVYNEEFSNE